VERYYSQPLFIAREDLGIPNVARTSTVGFVWSNGSHRLAPRKTPHLCSSRQSLRRLQTSLHSSLHNPFGTPSLDSSAVPSLEPGRQLYRDDRPVYWPGQPMRQNHTLRYEVDHVSCVADRHKVLKPNRWPN